MVSRTCCTCTLFCALAAQDVRGDRHKVARVRRREEREAYSIFIFLDELKQRAMQQRSDFLTFDGLRYSICWLTS